MFPQNEINGMRKTLGENAFIPGNYSDLNLRFFLFGKQINYGGKRNMRQRVLTPPRPTCISQSARRFSSSQHSLDTLKKI